MEIKKETMLDDTGAANKRRKPKHWQTPHYPENTAKERLRRLSPLSFSVDCWTLRPSFLLQEVWSKTVLNELRGHLLRISPPPPPRPAFNLKEFLVHVECKQDHISEDDALFTSVVWKTEVETLGRGLRVCQLGSDGNRSLTQHTFIALLLHPKKCTKIWDCVTQQRKRLISGKPPCLGRETEYQHKVVKSYQGGECHESMEEGFQPAQVRNGFLEEADAPAEL
ncbi:uncharacterized protein [Symphalangus syndactylus]|uniref:uncharacterized protein n=1 Tax=Symphalangus syndactylus TaxID=9590 RepID=UPI003004909B